MSDATTAGGRASVAGSTVPYLVALVAAFAAAGVVIALLGYDVADAYRTIFTTSFRTANGAVQTLQKFVPLVLQALAFTVPLATRKFNIGGEGQLLVGAIGAAAVGILLPEAPSVVAVPLLLLAGVLFGAVWAGIAALLLYRFGINEILTTVLLNFVSFSLLGYVATEVWSDPAAGHPATQLISQAARLPRLLPSPPLHGGLLLALAAAAVVVVLLRRTTFGYELLATGANPRAAEVHGIDVRRMALASLVIGGALAGLSGAIEVGGVHFRATEGMQSNYLLLGIIIGLLAKGNNVAVPFIALFIAVLEVGASAMQRTMGIPSEVVVIVEGMILLFVLLSDVVREGRWSWRRA